MIGANGVEPGNAVQNISRMPKHIFGLLGRFIGYRNQCTECGNIHKVLVIELPHVADISSALEHPAGGIHDASGNTQPPGEVVGGATGNVSDRHGHTAVHDTMHHLIQGAVSAGAGDHIIIL